MQKLNENITKYILWVLFILEFLFVVYANLFRIPDTLDNDAAKLFTHAIEMWNTKQIFIPTWVNETMLELDTALLVAVPIYGITGNIIVSFGLANIIILVAFYYFFFSLLGRIGQPLEVKVLACLLLTIPYSFGQLLYFNMMFFAGGFYGIKILLPFMIIWVITTPKISRNIWFYIVTIISSVFSCLFSISSGPYTMVTVIAPICVFYIWKSASKMDNPKEIISAWLISLESVFMYIQIIASMLGIYIGIKMQVNSSGGNIKMISKGEFSQNLLLQIENFFEGFGAFPYDETRVLSLNGISSLCHIGTSILILAVLICIIGKIPNLKDRELIEENKGIYFYLFVCVLWNLMIAILCNTGANPRYMLMTTVILLPFVAMFYYDFAQKVSSSYVQKLIINAALIILLVMTILFSNVKILKNDCVPEMNFNIVKYENLLEILNNRDEKQAILLDDTGMTEYLRVYDYESGREYLSYITESNMIEVHDYYKSHTDASFIDDKHLLIVDDQITSIDKLPDYILSAYEEIDSWENLHVFSSSTNHLDGPYGYENNDHSVDFPYPHNYQIMSGNIDRDGVLRCVGNDENVLLSPWINNSADKVTVGLNYDSKDNGIVGRLIVWDCKNQEIIAERDILGEDGVTYIKDVEILGKDISVQVYLNKNCSIGIKSIEYFK